MKKAVFIERDGVLNKVKIGPKHQISPLTFDEFMLLPSLREQIDKFKANGFLVIVTTNQPGLSRGYQSRRELDRMHEFLRKSLEVTDVFVCPHDESDHCPCRAPRPGQLIEAAFKHHLNLDHSFVVSDKWQDAEAARTAGCTSVLIRSPWVGQVYHDHIVPTFEDAVNMIISLGSRLDPENGKTPA